MQQRKYGRKRSTHFVIACCAAVLLHNKHGGGEFLYQQSVAKVAHTTILKQLATHNHLVAAKLPAVVLIGAVVDRGGNTLSATLEARPNGRCVRDPRPHDCAFSRPSKEYVCQQGQGDGDRQYGYNGMYAALFCHFLILIYDNNNVLGVLVHEGEIIFVRG